MCKTIEILGQVIEPGSSHQLSLQVAKMHTRDHVETPIIVERGLQDGPVVLFNGGVHGDEVNGVEIVRRIVVQGINKPTSGTVISIPVLNTFAFSSLTRTLPDGRDLNRVFPGRKQGSLASQLAYHFTNHVLKHVDFLVDYHTGGAYRSNIAQLRCAPNDDLAMELAKIFGVEYIFEVKTIPKSVRSTMRKLEKTTLLFEGGKTLIFDEKVIQAGVNGARRVLNHLGMRDDDLGPIEPPIIIKKSRWLRAPSSGMLHLKSDNGVYVKKGTLLASITDPYGDFEKEVKAPFDCHVFCSNTSSVVYRGDALFHISVETEK